MKTPLVLLLGPPGAGKSTQVRRLAARLGWLGIDFGDVVRSAVAAGSALGQQVVAHRQARADPALRTWLPDPLCRALLDERLAASPSPAGVLLDGYPRLAAQASYLTRWRLLAALHLVVPAQERRRRLDVRLRPEDAPASEAARLLAWEQDTLALVDGHRRDGTLVELDASGSEDEVTERLVSALIGRGLVLPGRGPA